MSTADTSFMGREAEAFTVVNNLYRLLSPAEVLGALLAALCHDADHPGMNQLHLERTGNFLVSLYNANSVLEKHHARVGLTILHRSGLARSLSKTTWTVVRDCMIKLIEATDMAYQGLYKAKFTHFDEMEVEWRKRAPLTNIVASFELSAQLTEDRYGSRKHLALVLVVIQSEHERLSQIRNDLPIHFAIVFRAASESESELHQTNA
ncbi:unnamed protein product [Echinostoma caproni]|uniref:PDEase domain-containing protein n=1 Tax=Echinostoma caproni TaxID=27848 RepID=A0A183AVF9_9TREM|nr:unnamed protein product [Echinostoma caproni]